jgi:hypothetical protein
MRFSDFDIELVDVLIGKPDTAEASGDIETLLDQLRMRQLAREQVETYRQQCSAAEKLKELKMAQALAEKQTELTNSTVQIQIAENRGEADLVQGRKRATQSVVEAEAENKKRILLAEAESKAMILQGEGESRRVALEGEAQARVLEQKINSYGDSRLYALSLITEHLSQSRQPLVPQRLFVSGANGNGKGDHSSPDRGLLGTLIELLVAERTGFVHSSSPDLKSAHESTVSTTPSKPKSVA